MGVDGTSRGTISFIVGAAVFLSFADNGLLNGVWVGDVRYVLLHDARLSLIGS